MDDLPHYPTQLRALDRELNGGIPAGSVVMLRAPPEVATEKLLTAVLRANTPSIHASILRPAQPVRQEYQAENPETSPQVVNIDTSGVFSESSDLLRQAEHTQMVAYDPIDELEQRGADQYYDFLRTASQVARAEQTVIMLHGHTRPSQTPARARTLAAVDTVFTISQEFSGQQVDYYLSVSRNRLGKRPDERLKLNIGDDVALDTSRDIA